MGTLATTGIDLASVQRTRDDHWSENWTWQERVRVAFHEAGHAVAARTLGVEIVEVDMLADGGPQVLTNPAVCDDPAAEAHRLRARLIVTLSAPVALCLAGYKFDNDIDGHDEDAECVFARALLLARFEAGLPMMPGPGERMVDEPLKSAMRGIVERAWAEAVALLWDNWLAVTRVAAALTTHDRLSQTATILPNAFSWSSRPSWHCQFAHA